MAKALREGVDLRLPAEEPSRVPLVKRHETTDGEAVGSVTQAATSELECGSPIEQRPVEPNDDGGYATGVGYGDGQADAEDNAARDAVFKAALDQYSCAGCPEGQDGCELISSNRFTGSAWIQWGEAECEQTVLDNGQTQWRCEGPVIDYSAGVAADKPSASLGCDSCYGDACDKPTIGGNDGSTK